MLVLQIPHLPCSERELLQRTQQYLYRRKQGHPGKKLEDAWRRFYQIYDARIRRFGFKCHVPKEEIVDFVQEVWLELLIQLPRFHLDVQRGCFDSWLFTIVRSKAVNLLRSRGRRSCQACNDLLPLIADAQPDPFTAVDNRELLTTALEQLRRCLSHDNFQILRLRVLENCPVSSVSGQLGLSNEQVWYRLHRIRRELRRLGRRVEDNRPRFTPTKKIDAPGIYKNTRKATRRSPYHKMGNS